MNIGTIQGGTHAGWRRVLPERQPWDCLSCGRHNGKHLVQCLGCGARVD